jgi:hypothetical protein
LTMADKGTANQCNCCHPQSQHTAGMSLNPAQRPCLSEREKKALIEL